MDKIEWKNPSVATGLGVTTNSFSLVLKNGEISLEKLLAYFVEKGFSWVELRDLDGKMSVGECERVKVLAKDLGLDVHYAWNNRDIDQEEMDECKRYIEKAEVFGPNTYCRIAIAPQRLAEKYGYSEEDLNVLVPKLCERIEYAQLHGVKLCFENSMEPIAGSAGRWGMEKLFMLIPELLSTFDAANMTSQVKENEITTEDLVTYYEKNKEHLPYFHLKTSIGRCRPGACLEESSDFELSRLLEVFVPEMMVCLELPPAQTLDKIQRNVEKSLDLLNARGHLL